MSTLRGGPASGATTETMMSETEESQNRLPGMTQPVAEAELEERVEQSESCDITIHSCLE